MVEFNGNNYYDNRIVIDYVKKKVFFTPVSIKHFMFYYMMFLFNCIAFLMNWALLPFLAFVMILVKVEYMTSLDATSLFNFTLIVFSFGVFLMSTSFLIPYWRKNWYPIFMSNVFLASYRKKKIITPEQMQFKNKVIIPRFKNIGLSYELYGDFKDIKRITIKEIFEKDPYNWSCLFLFNRNIKKGKMIIQFI